MAPRQTQQVTLSASEPGPLCLVTGATGYVGGRLVPELLAAGYRVRCLVRVAERAARPPVGGPGRDRRGRRDRRAEDLDRALADVDVAYYLIHALGSDSFETEDRAMAAASARPPSEPAWAASSTSAACSPTDEAAVAAPALAGGGRRDPARLGRADRGAAGRGDHRLRLGVVRDAALPHRAAAGDGHPPVGRQPHPADRHPRRAALPGGGARVCRPRSTAASTSAVPTCSPTRR